MRTRAREKRLQVSPLLCGVLVLLLLLLLLSTSRNPRWRTIADPKKGSFATAGRDAFLSPRPPITVARLISGPGLTPGATLCSVLTNSRPMNSDVKSTGAASGERERERERMPGAIFYRNLLKFFRVTNPGASERAGGRGGRVRSRNEKLDPRATYGTSI